MPVDYYPPGGGGADNIRNAVTGTAGSGKAITDDGSSGLAWAGPHLPLTGGTLTGAMLGSNGLDTGSLGLWGGSAASTTNGAGLILGAVNNALAGGAELRLGNASNGGFVVKNAGGTRQGGFPLTPSDMPSQYALEAVASSQTLNSNDYKTILYGTPGVNTGPAWSYSGGTWTCLIAGTYDIDAIIYAASSVMVDLYINKNGTRRYGGSAVICSSAPYVHRTIPFGAGDSFYIEAYVAGTGPALDVSIAGLRDVFINRRA